MSKQMNLPKLDAEPRRIVAKHRGTCIRCGCAVKAGSRVWWYPHNGNVVHEGCWAEGTNKATFSQGHIDTS